MPRKKSEPRKIAALFELAKVIGAENVLLADAELGAVFAGNDDAPYAPGTISNRRYRGELRIPVVRVGGSPRTRLSDALVFMKASTRRVG